MSDSYIYSYSDSDPLFRSDSEGLIVGNKRTKNSRKPVRLEYKSFPSLHNQQLPRVTEPCEVKTKPTSALKCVIITGIIGTLLLILLIVADNQDWSVSYNVNKQCPSCSYCNITIYPDCGTIDNGQCCQAVKKPCTNGVEFELCSKKSNATFGGKWGRTIIFGIVFFTLMVCCSVYIIKGYMDADDDHIEVILKKMKKANADNLVTIICSHFHKSNNTFVISGDNNTVYDTKVWDYIEEQVNARDNFEETGTYIKVTPNRGDYYVNLHHR